MQIFMYASTNRKNYKWKKGKENNSFPEFMVLNLVSAIKYLI